ncbi:MAG: hypothetical protein RLZZ282_1103, partial [Verrucomicrobiota bacterium]
MKTLVIDAHVVSPDLEIRGVSLLLEMDRIVEVIGAGEAVPEVHEVIDAGGR